MNTVTPLTETQATAPHYFIVAGFSLKSIRKELKPALPRKSQEASCLIVVTAATDTVKVAIAGAEVTLPAITSGSFVAEIPYLQLKTYLTYPYKSGALIRCELAAGSLSIDSLITKSPDILVQSSGGSAPATQRVSSKAAKPINVPAAPPVIANPLDATVGLPLLTAYAYIRKYGIQRLIGSKKFVEQQLEVDSLLNRVARLLRPVGITRSDLERLLDRKVGLS